MTDLEQIKNIVEAFDQGREALTKLAYTPAAPPAPPMTAMPPQGPMPADPNAMPPQGPPPGAPMDPNAMPPQGPPPADPGMVPPPPADPNAQGGGMSPEVEGALSQVASGIDSMAQTVEEGQAQTDQLSQRMLAMEEELNRLRSSLQGPAPFEGDATNAN